jgi:uncharacterized membrane protein
MKTVQYDVQSDQKASRVELFVRIIWGIISMIVLWILAVIAGICFILQWLYILVSGKRSTELNKVIKIYVRYQVGVISYLYLLTDERNPILPEG